MALRSWPRRGCSSRWSPRCSRPGLRRRRPSLRRDDRRHRGRVPRRHPGPRHAPGLRRQRSLGRSAGTTSSEDLAADETALAGHVEHAPGLRQPRGGRPALAAAVAVAATQRQPSPPQPARPCWAFRAGPWWRSVPGDPDQPRAAAGLPGHVSGRVPSSPCSTPGPRWPIPSRARSDASTGAHRGGRCASTTSPSATARTGRAVLDDVSLQRRPRADCSPLVGPSGAGKSTLVSLLLRFFDPEAGIASRSTAATSGTCPLPDLRRLVAVSFQDTYLFNRSVSGQPGRWPAPTPPTTRSGPRPSRPTPTSSSRALPDGYDTVARRTGRVAVRRATPATGHRPGAGGRRPGPGARRAHIERGRRQRGADHRRPGPAAPPQDHDRHRPPPHHRGRRRPGGGHRRRTDHRAGNARSTSEPEAAPSPISAPLSISSIARAGRVAP